MLLCAYAVEVIASTMTQPLKVLSCLITLLVARQKGRSVKKAVYQQVEKIIDLVYASHVLKKVFQVDVKW